MVCKAAMQESIRKGPWLEEEDERLATFVALMGERRWDSIARVSGLRRSGKSCRLRWLNYLRPDLKHEQLSAEEENIILKLQEQWGNKWSKIARKLPGRTDNEIKNYWRTYIRKKTQVEEHVKSQQERKYAKILEPQNLLTQRDAPKTNHYEQHGDTKEEILRATSEHPMDVFGSFDGACAISPSEAHLSDWICGPCNDQDAPKHHGQCTHGIILDSSFQYPAWVPGDMDSLWDYSSVSLWETDRA